MAQQIIIKKVENGYTIQIYTPGYRTPAGTPVSSKMETYIGKDEKDLMDILIKGISLLDKTQVNTEFM